ncbi:MAG: phosphate/phosphite/phosphonate ABC transporter substrate-binding protein [Acidimicrobiaceae bacterium]|nr:phosphate/phosphite/phosphonate ABC transporter substrate-binding protein [Acidimicrobiaceae bacterium]
MNLRSRLNALVPRPGRFRAGLLMTAAVATASAGILAAPAPAFANSHNPSWPSKLVLGEVGAENSTTLLASLAPVKQAMQKELGIDLEVTTGTSYASMIEAQQAGKAQLVGYGPFSYYIAKNVQHLKIRDIGILITAPHTDGGYYSEAVTNPKLNPQIKSLKDAKGKKVCFSDPASTSGYLYPSYGLLKVGISPTKGVTPVFTGTDTSTALTASKGGCQIGFTNDLSLPPAEASHAINKADAKVIWRGPEIPGNPVAISDSVPASLQSAMENFLVQKANSGWLTKHGYCTSVAKCTKIMGGWGYANPKVANFNKIKQVCALTKSPSCSKAS